MRISEFRNTDTKMRNNEKYVSLEIKKRLEDIVENSDLFLLGRALTELYLSFDDVAKYSNRNEETARIVYNSWLDAECVDENVLSQKLNQMNFKMEKAIPLREEKLSLSVDQYDLYDIQAEEIENIINQALSFFPKMTKEDIMFHQAFDFY